MNRKYIKIRKNIFSKKTPLDLDLLKITANYLSHGFLKNPASLNVYQYLTGFVKDFSEHYYKKGINNLKILDWGAGRGHVTFLLHKLGATPVSCDINNSRGDSSFNQQIPLITQKNYLIEPLEHEYNLPFESGSMDAVLSFGVLEHVSDDLKSLKEINRVLSDNSLFFCFYLPYFTSWTQLLAHLRGNHYHDRLYSKKSTYELLEKSGFNILDIWHRQLFPKNSIRYPKYHIFERIDQFLTENTPLKYLATNIEFVALKVNK